MAENLILCVEEPHEWHWQERGLQGGGSATHLSPWGSDTLVPRKAGTCLESWDGVLPLPDSVVLKSILHTKPIIPAPGRLRLEYIEWTLSWLELVAWVSIPSRFGEGFVSSEAGWGLKLFPWGYCSLESRVLVPPFNSHCQVVPPNPDLQRLDSIYLGSYLSLFSFHFYYPSHLFLLQKF